MNSLVLNPVTEEEIKKIINSFSKKKAVRPHSIPIHILKGFKKPLSVRLPSL